MAIKHKKHSDRADDGDAGDVNPSNWNDDHDIDGLLGALLPVGLRAGAFPYLDADQAGQMATLTAFGRLLMALADAPALLATLAAAPLASPAFTGVPTAPTAALGVATPQIATMAALKAMRDDLVASAPGALDTLLELATALGNDPNFATTTAAALGNRLRVDAAQGLTSPQKAQAIANLALAAVAVSGAYSDLTGKPTLGSAAALNVGTAANQIVQLDGTAKIPALNGSLLTGIVAAWAAITGKPTFGTASALDAGTGPNNVVQLDGSSRLPAVDGSQITGLAASPIKGYISFSAAGGTITVKKAFNATVTRSSAGNYAVSWTTPPPNANYVTLLTSSDGGSGAGLSAGGLSKTTAGYSFLTFNPTTLSGADTSDINVIAIW